MAGALLSGAVLVTGLLPGSEYGAVVTGPLTVGGTGPDDAAGGVGPPPLHEYTPNRIRTSATRASTAPHRAERGARDGGGVGVPP
ncbi:hypothetical protein SAMN05660350_03464 [Geodermatophilus obscurus]|uniref:Uncharacterized protein n=1 Tax=Geodermatophilus obscurus TaxID=1861 RepID=A0A1M7UL64_9ACTN|nr:hypothetical protein SAMN05660350_03464 [Geodermatophilus obscurus]